MVISGCEKNHMNGSGELCNGWIRLTKPDSTDSTVTMICLGACAYVSIYECIYECLVLPGVLWVSCICGLLCFVILENSWLFCLQVFFPLLSLFIYRQIYFHWVFLKALFVFIIRKKWSIYLLKVMSTKRINFLLVVNKKICQQINVFPLTF